MRRPIARVSTRGYYDLASGKTLKDHKYYLYPKKAFARLPGSEEIAIMVHGLRNDSRGAAAKAVIARKRLRQLGYRHPVIGYSYDSNTTGAHLARSARRALKVGQRIAAKNGRNLSTFIRDFKAESPDTKIRLLGHSLGSQVILSAAGRLARAKGNSGIIESVHLFGASIPADAPSYRTCARILDLVVAKKMINHFNPADNVLSQACSRGIVNLPLGLVGAKGRPFSKYVDKRVSTKDHRFASYAAVLRSFP